MPPTPRNIPLETNREWKAHESRPSDPKRKGESLETIHFQVRIASLRGAKAKALID